MTFASTTRENTSGSDNGQDLVLRKVPEYGLYRVLPGRFFRKINFEPNGCWIWEGSTWGHPRYPAHKYGQMRGWDFTKRVSAHVFAYETVFGPVPEGFELDHTCQNKLCANPNHVEVVTHAENMRRRPRPEGWERDPRKLTPCYPRTECVRGHLFTEENTYIPADGRRRCRECNKTRARKFRCKLLGLGLLALSLFSLALPQFGPAAVAESNTPMITRVSIAYPFATSSVGRQELDQIVSKVLPRLRMLKVVLERKPITFIPYKQNPQYRLTYYQETLECGHEFTSFQAIAAKRRNCQSCAKAETSKAKAAVVGVA